MLVEFAGLPGSGKTTVTRLLAQKLIDARIPVQSAEDVASQIPRDAKLPRYLRARADRLLLHRFVRFQRDHPELSQMALDAFEDAPIRHLLFSLMAASHQGARDNQTPGQVAVLDEGFVSHAVAMFFGRNETDRFKSFLQTAPLSDIVIVLDLAAENAFDRVVARNEAAQNDGESHSRTLKKFGDAEAFGRRRDMFQMATEIYRARGAHICVFNTNDLAASDIAERVFDELVKSGGVPAQV